ncbi:MAG: DUF6531 domain-containing protein, partial [Oscillospiraceae bacterium]|nr:DUF6531 domain-containing protein [Oscillospiraceae bacterium]
MNKKRYSNRILSLVLCVCLVIGMIPMAQAIELEAGEFNPNTGKVIIDFSLQYTQEVSIEVLINGEHFGWLIQREELTGTDGAFVPHNINIQPPYTIPAPSDQTNSAGVALSDEVSVDPQVDENGNLVGDGYYTITWTGSINGCPVVSANPDSDRYELTISIQPQGYPDNGIEADGTDWIWTQQYVVESTITIDYATILDAKGLSELLELMGNNQSYELFMEQMKNISNWAMVDDLYSAVNALWLETDSDDPVNLIDGNYFFSYTDLQLEGQYPLSLVRSYSSHGGEGGMGQGFTHSFDYQLTEENGFVHVSLPGGEELIFLRLRDFESADYYTVQNREFTLEDLSGGGYQMNYKRGNAYEFDADGRLIEIRNDLGIAVYTLTYSGDELERVTGVNGYLDFAWSGGHITSVTDSTGRRSAYTYDGDNLASVTNPDNDTLTYSYDSNGYLSAATDFEGDETVRNTYDEKGRVTYQVFINADEETVNTFSYNDSDLVNTYTNAQGRETKYYYDEYRNLLYT